MKAANSRLMFVVLAVGFGWAGNKVHAENEETVAASPKARALEDEALEEKPVPLELGEVSNNEFLKGIKTIAVIGDSLTEGYGVSSEQTFPVILENLFHRQGRKDIKVQSSGSSGSTSASGPSRVEWALRSNPDLVILALGANDGLRGLAVDRMKENLAETIRAVKKGGAQVVLAGMKAPPNMGKSYTEAYERAFQEVAAQESIPLFPFLLDGIAGNRDLNISDGIHPNEKGHRVMAQNLYNFLSQIRKL